MNTNKIQSLDDLSKEQLIQLLILQTQTSNNIHNGIEQAHTQSVELKSNTYLEEHISNLLYKSEDTTRMDDLSCVVLDGNFDKLNYLLQDDNASEIKQPNTDVIVSMDSMKLMIDILLKLESISMTFESLNILWQSLEDDNLLDIINFKYPFCEDFNELSKDVKTWSDSSFELANNVFKYSFYTSKITPSHP